MSWDAYVPPPTVEWSGAEVSEYTPLADPHAKCPPGGCYHASMHDDEADE